MKTIFCLALSLACMGVVNVWAADSAQTSALKETLAAVKSAELPAKAASLVHKAKARERETTTVDVVKAAVGINPAGAPAIVSAIARSEPEMAALAAGPAAKELPKQAAAIARAAAAAAPSKAGLIVAAVCRLVPHEYRNIAMSAAQAAPGHGKEVLNGLSSTFPSLKPGIDHSLAIYRGNPPSVGVVLAGLRPLPPAVAPVSPASPVTTPTTIANPAPPVTVPIALAPLPASGGTVTPAAPTTGQLARGPAVGPPYIPLSGTPTNVTSGTSGDVPSGGT